MLGYIMAASLATCSFDMVAIQDPVLAINTYLPPRQVGQERFSICQHILVRIDIFIF